MSKKVALTVAKSLLGLTLILQAGYSADSSGINIFTEADCQRLARKIFEDAVDQKALDRELDSLEKLTEKFDSDLCNLIGPHTYHLVAPSNAIRELQGKCEKEIQEHYKTSLKRDIMNTFKNWGIDKLPSQYSMYLEVLKTIRCEDNFGTQAVLDELVKEITLKKEQLWPLL